jgi:hypothetical protein
MEHWCFGPPKTYLVPQKLSIMSSLLFQVARRMAAVSSSEHSKRIGHVILRLFFTLNKTSAM